MVLLTACGGKPRVVPPPRPASHSQPGASAVRDNPAPVRVLLCEQFSQIEVRGARRADQLWIEVQGDGLVLRPVSSGAPVERGTGFRLEAKAGGGLSIAGKSYRGALEAFINPLGVAVLVNDIDIEDYLRGVVPNELGPRAFPLLEALKAQSVAARTYALRHSGSQVRRGFDMFDDNRSQVYAGVQSEDDLSDRAIRETAGVIASFEGEPIWALYSSTCGGLTEGFRYAFGGPSPPYLEGGASCFDQQSRYYRWSRVLSPQDLRSALSGRPDIGRPEDIRLVNRSPTGRLTQVEIVGSRGRVALSGPQFRSLLDLRSTAVDVVRIEHDSQGAISSVEIQGRGWGHGVGLCQMGAVHLAGRGFGYAEILRHYYQGIDVTTAR